MAKGSKKLAAKHRVPQDDNEANAMIDELGAVRRDLELAKLAKEEELAAVRARHEAGAEPLKALENELRDGLEVWSMANRERLTEGGRRKYAQFPAGFIRWRARPPKVILKKGFGEGAVIELMKLAGLGRFIRQKEELNREAMLAEPEAAREVAGVSIASDGEDFVVEPHEEELAKGAAA